MLPPIAFFSNPKTLIREKMKGERRAAAALRPDAAKHAARHFMNAFAVAPGACVALYHPIHDELDTGPLADALAEKGVQIALPAVIGIKQPLIFRVYAPGDALYAGAYGAKVPADSAEDVRPQIIVAPLLAFTKHGGRLGYGGGYYDRTLKALRAQGDVTAVGYGYGAQEVDALPLSRLDQPLDWIVTERGAIRCS